MAILKPLLATMATPVVLRCPDGHYRRIIYDLAAFIADHPGKVYLAGTVQGWCPKFVFFLSVTASTLSQIHGY